MVDELSSDTRQDKPSQFKTNQSKPTRADPIEGKFIQMKSSVLTHLMATAVETMKSTRGPRTHHVQRRIHMQRSRNAS